MSLQRRLHLYTIQQSYMYTSKGKWRKQKIACRICRDSKSHDHLRQSQERRIVYADSIGGAAVRFHPDRKPAPAAIVPKRPTQASLKSPVERDQWSVKGRYPKLTQNSFKIASLRSSRSSHSLLVCACSTLSDFSDSFCVCEIGLGWPRVLSKALARSRRRRLSSTRWSSWSPT